jgi:hypothetical protein
MIHINNWTIVENRDYHPFPCNTDYPTYTFRLQFSRTDSDIENLTSPMKIIMPVLKISTNIITAPKITKIKDKLLQLYEK